MIELRNMMLGEILTCSANLAEQFINDRLELWLSDEDRDRARIALTSAGVKGKDLLVAIAPGAGHPKRLWPLRRFVDSAASAAGMGGTLADHRRAGRP